MRVRNDAQGQVVVEFALILFPLLILVTGIIQLGIGINFWLDQQRLASQGARVAIVNCAATSWCSPTLAEYLESQPLSSGNTPTATVCFKTKSGADGTKAVTGDAIMVDLRSPFELVPLLGIGTITISARATARLEQDATNPGIANEPVCA